MPGNRTAAHFLFLLCSMFCWGSLYFKMCAALHKQRPHGRCGAPMGRNGPFRNGAIHIGTPGHPAHDPNSLVTRRLALSLLRGHPYCARMLWPLCVNREPAYTRNIQSARAPPIHDHRAQLKAQGALSHRLKKYIMRREGSHHPASIFTSRGVYGHEASVG